MTRDELLKYLDKHVKVFFNNTNRVRQGYVRKSGSFLWLENTKPFEENAYLRVKDIEKVEEIK